jgi:hypothetical protein
MYDQHLISRRPVDGVPQTPLALSAYQRRTAFGLGERSFDFTPKGGDLVAAEIVAPDVAPVWCHDPQKLWQAAELAERYPDGLMASRFLLMLPDGVSPTTAVGLVRDFVATELVSAGMVVDMAIHCPATAQRPGPLHAHLLVPLREVHPWGLGPLRLDWFAAPIRAAWQDAWMRRIGTFRTQAA